MNADWDTELGGRRRDFPSTCWSRVMDGAAGDRRTASEELANAYWKPIYAYIRAKWAKTNEDAKDLTQDFFLWMMESGTLSKADPNRGRFRAFVKVALEHYLIAEQRRLAALKGGGDRRILALDAAPDELNALGIPDPAGRPPEEALDGAWRNDLLARAAARLETVLKEEGKETYFRIFRDYHLGASGKVEYRDVATRYGIGEKDVDNHLIHAKKRF